MDIHGKETSLSILEAEHLEKLTLYADSFAAYEVQNIIVNNLTAHAVDILPRDIIRSTTVPLRTLLVLYDHNEDPHAITVEFTKEHLNEIKDLATIEVHEANERAGNVDFDLAVNDALGEILDEEMPDRAATKVTLSERDEEAFKADLFKQQLEAAQLGAHIIAVITKHQQET